MFRRLIGRRGRIVRGIPRVSLGCLALTVVLVLLGWFGCGSTVRAAWIGCG